MDQPQPTAQYYVPEKSSWPLLGSVGLFSLAIGAVRVLHQENYAWPLILIGAVLLMGMMVGWFAAVIRESRAGLYSAQMDRSFRWGMAWFIFSELMFFLVFFAALFYTRLDVVPWLGGLGSKIATHTYLWPHFQASWPLLLNPDPSLFPGPKSAMSALGLPALNTAVLLCSGLTMTWAHRQLQRNQRVQVLVGLGCTIALGLGFVLLQAYEYHHAYTTLGLTLQSGIYGSTFFMLTGFHGLHVSIGLIMLGSIFLRCLRGHFNPRQHFAFEAVAWYWHFVDVVWLLVFVFVYCL